MQRMTIVILGALGLMGFVAQGTFGSAPSADARIRTLTPLEIESTRGGLEARFTNLALMGIGARDIDPSDQVVTVTLINQTGQIIPTDSVTAEHSLMLLGTGGEQPLTVTQVSATNSAASATIHEFEIDVSPLCAPPYQGQLNRLEFHASITGVYETGVSRLVLCP